MIKGFLFWFLLFVPSAVFGAQIYVEGSRVVFQGPIDESAFSKFKNLLRIMPQSVDTIRITSAGGLADSALEIGRLVKDRNLDIEVLDYCISACAQYIFVSARYKTVLPRSIVVFHGTPTSMLEEIKHSPLEESKYVFQHQAALEKFYYQNIKLSTDLLLGSLDALKPICVAELQNFSKLDLNRFGVLLKYAGYVPSIEMMRKYGVKNIYGYWPSSNSDLQITIKHLPFNKNFNVIFVDYVNAQNAIRRIRKERLPIC